MFDRGERRPKGYESEELLQKERIKTTLQPDDLSQKTRMIDLVPTGDAESSLSTTPELPRKSNQRYKFIRSIGFGGMKAVLLVLDVDTGREVAMAMMPDFRDRPAADVARFIREARVTARLEHPNIVPVHDMGTDLSGAPFFTMKYLRGRSLATILRQVRRNEKEAVDEFTIERAMQIFTRVCNAVLFAHSRNILHLDIKPDNVNIGNFGEVLLLDWGLATVFGHADDSVSNAESLDGLEPIGGGTPDNGNPAHTRNGVAKGTPGYMAPEQAAGLNDTLDARTDVYALGALLYSILSLHAPLAGHPVEEVIAATAYGRIPPVTEAAAGRYVPPALEAICRKAMMVNPDERYQSVAELRADIQAFSAGFAPEAENASPLRKTALFINRNFLESMMAGIILLLSGIIAYLIFIQ